MGDEVDTLFGDKNESFPQVNSITWKCVARHAQSTQNNKFVISLQYLKENVKHKVDFLHADEHESLLQVNSMIWMGMVKHSESSQNSKFAMSLQYLKKEVRNEVDFLNTDKHLSFLQVDFNTLDIKVSQKYSSDNKVLKVTNLQYLYNILKNKSGMEFIFCMQLNIKVSTGWHFDF